LFGWIYTRHLKASYLEKLPSTLAQDSGRLFQKIGIIDLESLGRCRQRHLEMIENRQQGRAGMGVLYVD
jgi:hypothetical protein